MDEAEALAQRAGQLLLAQVSDASDGACVDEAVDLLRRALAHAPAGHPAGGRWMHNFAVALRLRFVEHGRIGDVHEAVDLGTQVVAHTPAGHPAHADRFNSLAMALSERFGALGNLGNLDDLDDLDLAVECGRAAVALAAGREDADVFLANLAADLATRYQHTGRHADLDEAIETGRRAVAATGRDSPHCPGRLDMLATDLSARFEESQAIADLDEAVAVRRAAVAATPADDPALPLRLDALGIDLSARFARTGSAADLDAAVDAGRLAVAAARKAALPDLARYLTNLAIDIRTRFDLAGSPADLDAAVEARREALGETPGDHAERGTRLANLAICLATRFRRSASLGDLAEAIDLGRAAVAATPAGHPALAGRLGNLGNDLREMFDQTGELPYLDEAVELCQRAVDATPEDHPDRPAYLSNLASELSARSRRTGRFEDVERAVRLRRRVVAATPADHPDHSLRLANLAQDLNVTFLRLGRLADLDAAVEFFRRAVAATPPDHEDLCRRLDGLATSLSLRFQRTGRAADLDEAAEVGRQALAGTAADDSEFALRTANLALTLSVRFFGTHDLADIRSRDLADLDEAAGLSRKAIDALAEGHPIRADVQALLGSLLARRFMVTDAVSDIDEGVRLCRDAVYAALADGPDRAGWLINLGAALDFRFNFASDAEDDRTEGMACMREAAGMSAAAPTVRADGARRWAAMAVDAQDWVQAAEAYELSIAMSALAAPRGLPRRDQEYALAQLSGLPSDAAAACLQAGDGYRAVQLLEQGRGLLLAQALETRTDVTELHARHPELAEKFSGLCAELDRVEDFASFPASGRLGAGRDPSAPDRLEEAERRRRLAGELDRVVADIRRQPGFTRFLLAPPPPADTPLAGPVVLLNVASLRSDALVLRLSGVDVVRLPDVTPDAVRDNVAATAAAAGARTAEAERRLEEVLGWLWDAIAAPVLDHLGYLDLVGRPGAPGRRGRLWWSPSGLLSFLPLHAAGYHDHPGDTMPRTVMDRVVSSYAPTLRTLVHSRSKSVAPGPPAAAKILAVAMPETPGESPLPAVVRDVAFLRQRFPGAVEVLSGRDATHASVGEALADAGWAHFACHGVTDTEDPSAGRLLLADHESKPLTVVDVAKLRLGRAELAFLAACSTGQGSARLPDEAIHLASAFQAAGFRHVVATLWPTSDRSCTRVTRSVYTALSGGGASNSDNDRADRADRADSAARAEKVDEVNKVDEVAVALHDAALAVRRRHPRRPSQWAGYIHLGA